MKKYLPYLLILLLVACTPMPKDVKIVDQQPVIYPDYCDVTIPRNIAPLNFLLRGDFDACRTVVRGANDSLIATGRDQALFNIDKWRKLLADNDSLTVTVTARTNGKWLQFKPFGWKIAPDSIDRYLSYRLIEPGYEVFGHIQICERDVQSFEERVMVDNLRDGTGCINCHIYGKNGEVMYHRRGPGGGTMVARGEGGRKMEEKGERWRKMEEKGERGVECLALRIDSLCSPAIYGDWHPSGRYAIFSSNVIIPMLHSLGSKRLEVYDTISDVFAYDFDNGDFITSPLLTRKDIFETFPTFSADGKKAYFCAAPALLVPDSLRSLRYSLLSIDFDPEYGKFGTKVDTLWDASHHNASVCHPKASPDGKWLMYTVADYGTFPIWHAETDLHMLDLSSGAELPMTPLASDKSETYHSWSSNSRWIVFASKRGDGQYGRPYFAYIAADGTPSKPFVLPQRDPRRYDRQLTSFNIPDFSPTPSPF